MDVTHGTGDAGTRRARDRILLPYGIAMTLLAFGFTFTGARLRWLWVDTPYVAVLLVVLGVGCVAGAVGRWWNWPPR